MEETSESKRKSMEMTNLSLEIQKYPRDLLEMFEIKEEEREKQTIARYVTPNEETEELELNLGLSLGGRFGVDNTHKNKLLRSSSVMGTLPIVRDADNPDKGDGNVTKDGTSSLSSPQVSYASLMRTTSLPTETEEEWRKRKEMQCLRRMEAKRRRSEKQKSKECSGSEEKKEGEGQKMGLNLKDKLQLSNCGGSSVAPPWVVAAKKIFLGSGVVQTGSQGSVESQGGSSSGMSENECRPTGQGSGSYGETRSPAVNQSNQERNDQNMSVPPGTRLNQGPENRANNSANQGREIGLRALGQMPNVFTRGTGPNGKRVDGVLYQYGKGEEVRIMCICHGTFHSPQEFVKHAGGDEVEQPLKHIVVHTSSSASSPVA